MSLQGIAKVTCLLPRPHGYIRAGEAVWFDIEKWDTKSFPWLENFDQVKPVKGKPVDNDPLK